MRYQSIILAAATVASVSARAHMPLSKREEVNDPNGNIKITFSDETVKLGTITIETIIDALAKACSTQGQCDTSALEFKGQLVESGTGSVTDETLTVDPSGAYPTWIHNGLIDSLYAAVKAIAKCEDVTNTPTCGFSAYYCPSKPFTVTECVVPQYWGINYQAPDATNAAPPFIGADMHITLDEGGFCTTLLTSLGAVAGAVHGVGGGIFTLLSLACKD
ncbi:uncharacterized protein BDR25DRAFT_306336 [Lindgomyces ingoldianus]|uniref:Uncharacterized protein n=1 Tax=Lindgomyces ingoldianus TaxID=673940 RepID=A0ACB6QGQ3_9PLEO|nr:uncharacterized protein BDR25DRAFT_306336 [Lindgomyces ingoldianus]KAF2466174.1 hypothetical protein BDR25DRAFT_306336 [Lindgomyces ingoldianus]